MSIRCFNSIVRSYRVHTFFKNTVFGSAILTIQEGRTTIISSIKDKPLHGFPINKGVMFLAKESA
jgi:hypothetical protein